MRRILVLCGLLLAAPTLAQSDLDIDARRLDVMMDQSEAALHALAPALPVAPSAAQDDADAFQSLAAAIHRYDAILAQACRAKLVGQQLCSAPYDPPWLKTRPSDLRAAIDEAAERITPFWDDVCTRARKATGDPSFCAME